MDAKAKISSKVFRKPRRVSITIPHATYLLLERRCYEEGRSLSGLSAYLLERMLSDDYYLAIATNKNATQNLWKTSKQGESENVSTPPTMVRHDQHQPA
jgi:hypothetical protein